MIHGIHVLSEITEPDEDQDNRGPTTKPDANLCANGACLKSPSDLSSCSVVLVFEQNLVQERTSMGLASERICRNDICRGIFDVYHCGRHRFSMKTVMVFAYDMALDGG
jgi:hypothetical protein